MFPKLRVVRTRFAVWCRSAARRAAAWRGHFLSACLAMALLLTIISLRPRLAGALYLNLASEAVARGYLADEHPDADQGSQTRRIPAHQALSFASASLNRIPDHPAAWRQKGRAWWLEDNVLQARMAFQRAIEIDPRDPISRDARANLYLAAGEHSKAMAEWRRLPAPVQLLALGDALVAQGNWGAGLAAYRSVIAAAPDFMAAYYHLGEAQYRYLGDLPGALATFGAARKQAPWSPWPYVSIGDLYAAEDRLQAAIPWYRRALEAAPNEPGLEGKLAWAYTTYGDGLLQQERWAEAERAYRAALEAMPAYLPAYHSLARLSWKGRGDPAAAVHFLQQAIAIDPHDKRTYALLEDLMAMTHPNSR